MLEFVKFSTLRLKLDEEHLRGNINAASLTTKYFSMRCRRFVGGICANLLVVAVGNACCCCVVSRLNEAVVVVVFGTGFCCLGVVNVVDNDDDAFSEICLLNFG